MHRSYRAALAGALLALAPMSLQAHPLAPPAVPAGLEIPEGHKPFLIGHATGTQNYVCLPSVSSPSGVSWILFGPQATLFADRDREITTHYLSPNPDEGGTARATWHHQDSSRVWAVRFAGSSDPAFVDPDAIPWLRLQVVGAAPGPGGGRKLTETTWLQRVNTAGGQAPATDCAGPSDVGRIALIPYEADYVFFRSVRRP